MEPRFVPKVEEVLRRAGWYPGRKVPEEQIEVLNQIHPLFPAARRVFEEFYGIYVEAEGIGEWGAFLSDEKGWRHNPDYRPNFCINPAMDPNGDLVAIRDTNDIQEAERDYGFKLYLLGYREYQISPLRNQWLIGGNITEIFIDVAGRVFFYFDEYIFAGDTFDRALHNMILKVHSKDGGRDGGMCAWDIERNAPRSDS